MLDVVTTTLVNVFLPLGNGDTDMSSPLNYGTPSSRLGGETPCTPGALGTPIRPRADIRGDRRPTVNIGHSESVSSARDQKSLHDFPFLDFIEFSKPFHPVNLFFYVVSRMDLVWLVRSRTMPGRSWSSGERMWSLGIARRSLRGSSSASSTRTSTRTRSLTGWR